jgi:hypothetical protein
MGDRRMSNLEIIWDALCSYREECNVDDTDWDNICSVMAKVEESLEPELWVGLTSQHMEIAK